MEITNTLKLCGSPTDVIRNTRLLVEEDEKFYMPYDKISLVLHSSTFQFFFEGKQVMELVMRDEISEHDTVTIDGLKGLAHMEITPT